MRGAWDKGILPDLLRVEAPGFWEGSGRQLREGFR
ncbi:hypothetical protein Marky_0316 [Marinithermus hydrothermalis DSM 14884]|uniref:Uncharacterized protein n=1 Tax=Marinithermus hydrothermalis (strain DSM 14884 / JCM 11576 / T1) TaxID=869210 RepID=F2NPX0_MARHT|nr:hypothetical protein Marky_0316 [Marinithermus hydrothermalis DSM 14884]